MINSTVFFILDQKADWLSEEFARQDMPIKVMCPKVEINHKSFRLSRIRRILYLHTKYLKVAIGSLAVSKKGDILICWLDVMAIYVLLLSKILCRERKIVAINIMFNDDTRLLTRIKKKCMRWLLSDKNIFPTVTSKELPDLYRETFDLPDKNFFLLYDTYGDTEYRIQNTEYRIQNTEYSYVFCGGKNARDWLGIKKIAESLSALKFVIVGPRKDTLGENVPKNIEYHYSISHKEYLQLLANARIVTLPLNTEAPAGLIVLCEAALLHKAVVTTDNSTMREYISSGENGYLIKKDDYKAFADKVKEIFSDTQMQKEFGEKLYGEIIDKCSPKIYVSNIINIVNTINV